MSDFKFTLRERTAISRAFDAGNYANAYESTNLNKALKSHKRGKMSAHERAAFVLGFFGSYTLDEIGSELNDVDLWREINAVIQQGLHITKPVRDPRRVPMPDMSWLGPPPPKTKR